MLGTSLSAVYIAFIFLTTNPMKVGVVIPFYRGCDQNMESLSGLPEGTD